MKFALAAVVVAVCAFYGATASSYGRHGHGHQGGMNRNATDMVRENGYPVQNFTVTTSDGYILDVVRVPGPRSFRNKFESQQQEQGRRGISTGRPPVILWHAMLSSCEDFVFGGPTEGLAFVLADAGFDVFMANTRGSRYGMKHTTMNPERDAQFWNFCFEDIAKKDLPAVIDHVLEMTSMEKVYFVGHMEGATPLFVLNSIKPEYNRKVEMMVALGPMVYMKGACNEAMKLISQNYESTSWVYKNLGMSEFHPSTDFISQVNQDCMTRGVNERICQNPFFLINGYESDRVNTTTIERYMYNLPTGTSTKNVLHYAHLIKSGRFESYNENMRSGSSSSRPSHSTGTKYDLTQVTTPISIIYASKDSLVREDNIELLASDLPSVVDKVRCNECSNNLDLLFTKNVKSNVYNSIISAMRSGKGRQ